MKKKLFQPKSFVLQWHITERCNWRCKHCYQSSYTTSELNLKKMEEILIQYVDLLKKWRISKENTILQITGGEPFIRDDFPLFLDIVKKYSEHFQWAILSNGSLLDENIAKKLKSFEINFFQLSLEGLEAVNDEIRGKGSYRKILGAINLLVRAKIRTVVSFTLTKKNFAEVKKLSENLAPLGVSRLAVRRIAPFGLGGNQLKNLVLEPQELREMYKEIEDINRKLKESKYALIVSGGCENAVFNDEISNYELMGWRTCAVNEGRCITLMPDGEATICRRYPIKIGNVRETSLEEIYYSSLDKYNIGGSDAPLECHACSNFKACLGGAKCVTYALTGKSAPDVQCWKLFDNLDESIKYIKHPKLSKKLALFLKNIKRTAVRNVTSAN